MQGTAHSAVGKLAALVRPFSVDLLELRMRSDNAYSPVRQAVKNPAHLAIQPFRFPPFQHTLSVRGIANQHAARLLHGQRT